MKTRFTTLGADVSAAGVLICDVCRREIGEHGDALVSWSADDSGSVQQLVLVHGRCDQRLDLELTKELDAFSCPESALRNLMNLHRNYHFTGEQSRKLAYIAWAAAALATPEERRASNKHMREWAGVLGQ